MISSPSVGGCLHGGAALTFPGIDGEDPFVDNHETAADLSEDGQLLRAYNRMADMYGLNPLQFGEDPEEFSLSMDLDHQSGERRGWFARAFGKPPVPLSRRSSRHSAKSDRSGKHRQNDDAGAAGQDASGSSRTPKDTLRSASLKTLVRICGKSLFYLPNEYATRSLTLPTCIRATAQYLAQNGPETRGVFRISGATRVVIELYDYYCSNIDETDIAATVRSPNLPFHIKYTVHDVATVFKRILAGLPGGILGQLPLFDALVGIYTKCSSSTPDSAVVDVHHVRARLIALAVGAVPCPLQRELICAVFGLLCRIGRAAEAAEAEAAANEDADAGMSGNSELMGYGSLGIIFGPLLLGDLLALSAAEGVEGAQAPVTLPAALTATTSPRPRAERRRKSTASDKRPLAAALTLDKVLLANNIAEMLIKHWTEVVDQMRKLATMRKKSFMQQPPCDAQEGSPKTLRSSRSETFSDLDLDQDHKTTPQPLRTRRPRLRKTRSAYITQDNASAGGAGSEQRQLPPPASHRRSADETPALRGRYPSMERESPDKASTFMKQVVAAFSPIEEKLYELSPGLVSPPHFSGRPPRSRDGDASPWRFSTEAAATEDRTIEDSSPSKAAALLARIRNSHRPAATPTPSPTKRPEKRSQMLADRDLPAAMSVAAGCRDPVAESGRKRLRKTARAGSGEAHEAAEQADTVLVNPKRRWRGRTFSQMVEGMKGITDTTEENRPITPKRGKQQGAEEPRETSWEMELPAPLSEIKNESKSPQKANARAMRTPGKSKADAAAAAAAAAAAEGNKSTPGNVKAMAAMFDNGLRGPPAAQPTTTREPPKTPTRLSHYTTNHSPPKTEPPGKVSPPMAAHGPRPARVSDGGSPEAVRDTADDKTRRLRRCRSDERIRRSGEMTRGQAGGRGKRDAADRPRDKKSAAVAAVGTPPPKAMAKTTATTATTTDALVSSMTLTAHTAELSHPPGQHAAYSLLLAQLRNLQQQLEAKTAECQSWKQRAETAEKAMAELEGYTELLHSRYGTAHAETAADVDADNDNDNGYTSDSSNMTVVVHGEMADETD